MLKLKFKGKIYPAGNSYVVTIPKDYIKNRLLLDQEEYTFIVDEE